VQKRGDEMSYTIAADVNGKCAKKYMEAVGSDGIPTVMIVDRAGRLAWIGHPMEGMDEALGQIIAGNYDLTSAAKAHAAKNQGKALAAPLISEIKAAKQASDWPRFIAAADKLVALDPDTYGNLTIEKFRIMLDEMDAPGKAFAYAGEMISGPWAKNSMALNAFAWTVVESGTPNLDWNMALAAAQKASSLAGDKDPNILDTLAAVHFKRGDVAKAVEVQKQAVSLLPAEDAAEFKQRLAEYQKAAGAAH
jgi:tetratricopeptide (TPR) repeat protein